MRYAVPLLMGIAVLLVACGDDEALTPSPTVSASPTPAPVTASPIPVGCLRLAPPIQVVDVATGDVTVPANGRIPVWSPDGASIAFARPVDAACERELSLFVLDLATGATRQVYEPTTSSFLWSWSPDGASIAVALNDANVTPSRGLLDLIDVDTGSITELFKGVAVTEAVWSADGARLAYAGTGDDGSWTAHVVDTTTGDTIAEITGEAERAVGLLRLSPNGGSLAYYEVERDFNQNPVRFFLYAGAVGAEPLLILETAEIIVDLAWSADGATLAAVTGPRGASQIYTGRPDSSGLRRIAAGWSPSWAPDANLLAFVDDPCGESMASVMAPDGSGQRALAPGQDDSVLVTAVRWSPVGDLIAIETTSGIYVVAPGGSGLRKLTDTAILAASWSPDGSRLAGTPPSGQGFCESAPTPLAGGRGW